MRGRKDSRIHSFGLLDVDVWTLRRFRKSKEENNINSLHFLFLPYFPTKKKNICLTSKRPRPNVHFPMLAKNHENIWYIPINFILLHGKPMRSCSRSIVGKYSIDPRL